MKSELTQKQNNLIIFNACNMGYLPLHLVNSGINAGFPSPADDFIDASIDLNKEYVKHPSSTFYGRARGNSMIDAGISDGDLLIIDKSLEPKNNKIAVCYINGEFTVKRIKIANKAVWLIPANKEYKPILITPENEFMVWGIVTAVIKSL